ncbi:hypothetical protein WAI453_004714 [Rhynchosporium graminicola]
MHSQNKVIAGLRYLLDAYEKKLSDILWVAGSKSFGIYGQIFSDVRDGKLDMGVSRSEYILECHKSQMLQRRLTFANVTNKRNVRQLKYMKSLESKTETSLPSYRS